MSKIEPQNEIQSSTDYSSENRFTFKMLKRTLLTELSESYFSYPAEFSVLIVKRLYLYPFCYLILTTIPLYRLKTEAPMGEASWLKSARW